MRRKYGLTIEGVINTHFHADFVSGHLELVEATGAWIGFGEAAETDYPIRRLADGRAHLTGRGRPGDPVHARAHLGIDQRGRARASRRRADRGADR